MPIPIIDERVRYVGVTFLRTLNAKTLRELADLLVIQVDEKPVAVIVPYAMYMEAQKALWPSSLLPSLGKLFQKVTPDVDCPSDLVHQGTQFKPEVDNSRVEPIPSEPGPTMKEACAAVDEMHETPSDFYKTLRPSETPSTLEEAPLYVCDGVTHDTLGPHGSCSQHPETRPVVVSAIETDNTPRGHRLTVEEERELRDNPPPITIDDVDSIPRAAFEAELYQSYEKAESCCDHCGNPSEKPLCVPCFQAGHRAGNCLQCAEGKESNDER